MFNLVRDHQESGGAGAGGERCELSLRWRVRLLGVLTAGIVVSHTAAVELLYQLHLSTTGAESILEPVLVALFSFPALYFFALRPLLCESAGRRRAEHAQLASEELVRTEEKKALEKQLRRVQRLENIGTLAAGVAHDLNNILAPISMSAELLQMSARDSQDQEVLATILSSARRGSEVVRQVLTFARGIEGERVLLQPRYAVMEIERIVRETFPKTITFRRQVPAGLWPVLGDGTQLQQVLLNLCVNARDAMPQGGQLMLTCANVELSAPRTTLHGQTGTGPHVLLAVSDTGQGIPAGIIERIFEPFFTTKELGQGTGLGLSTVLGIVRSHGGMVDVESQPGRGATFKVYLPAQPGEAPPLAAPRARLTPTGQGQTILVVDDEPNVRKVAEQTLKRGGYQVLLAKDGREALELVPRHGEVKAVVTDILMPRLDGVGLVQGLKRCQAGLPVIACTGWGQEGVCSQLKELGVRTILNKPYPAEDLLRALRDELKGTAA